jgi:hypothetical protein
MKMAPDQVAMLAGGILLFVVALGLLIYFVATRRPFTSVSVLFLISVIMIGFPAVQHFKGLGIEVELKTAITAVEQHPNDPAAKAQLAAAEAQASRQATITPETLWLRHNCFLADTTKQRRMLSLPSKRNRT